MTVINRVGLAALLATSATACSNQVECSPSRVRAVVVMPVDASSSVLLASIAAGTAGFQGYSDSLRRGPSGDVGPDSLAGGARGGTYAVHVEAPGYQPFDTSGIVVDEFPGACAGFGSHAFSARMTAVP